MKKKTKTLLLCGIILVVAAVSALGIWFLTNRSQFGDGNVLGVAWYHENGTEFTISTAEELFELAELSKHYDFKDQTIKLNADIVINEGNAADWEFEYPEYIWEPIDNFAGTFDGQGHTISGVCGMGDHYSVDKGVILYHPTGLFTNTQPKCVIKDFKLLNSFFFSDMNEGVGSIASNGGGTFDSIYSDAIIVSYKNNNGGIIGMLNAKGSSTVTNCWFDGEVRVEGNYGRYNGGIVGRVCDTGGQNKIEHCLNTGKLTSTITGKGVNMGGIIGNIAPVGRANVTDCLATGELQNEYGVSVGVVIGCIEGNASATINDVYGRKESFKNIVGAVLGGSIGTPIGFGESMLKGKEGYRWTTLDFDNYWTIVEDDTPILSYFAEETPSLKGVKKAFNIDWYKKSKKEFTISTKEDLYGLAILSYTTNFLGKTVKLGADIVVNEGNAADWALSAPETMWIPIGTTTAPFAGIFDGNMHEIRGIYYKTNEAYGGMFPATTATTTIKNLKLTNSYFESSAQYLGSITGNGRGKFETIYSDAIVVSDAGIVAGFVGQVAKDGGVAMTNCWFDGTVISKGNTTGSRRAGGLVGFVLANTALTNCLNTGTIDVMAYTTTNSATNKTVAPLAGGVAGHIYKDRTITITDCLATGEIKLSDEATAGFGSVVGYSDGTTIISGVYATNESCKNTAGGSVKGLVKAIDANEISGMKGYQWTHLDFENNWAVVTKPTASTPILKAFAGEVPSVASVKRMIDVSWYDKDKTVYVIDSMEDLYGFGLMSYNTNFEGKTVKLGKNITVNSGNAANWNTNAPTNVWTPIGTSKLPFAGTFDGNMHSISGLYFKTDARYGGLFSVIDTSGIVKNLKLTNSYFESSVADIGSIAGWGKGTFDTIYSDAIVVGATARTGGMVGQGNGKEIVIKNCWYDGTVTNIGNSKADRQTGGILGTMYLGKLSMSNCLNTGTVDVTSYTFDHNTSEKAETIAPLAGGLVGYIVKGVEATISDSINVGNILTSKVANTGYGALIGWSEGGTTVNQTYATSESCKVAQGGAIIGSTKVFAEKELWGYKGYQWTLLDFNKYWSVVTNPSESTPILKAFASKVPSLSGVDKLVDISWMNDAKGTKEEPYVLDSMADLYGFATLSIDNNFEGKVITLGCNITVNGDIKNPDYNWTPISTAKNPFAGTFDGKMKKITGLYMDTTNQYAGLFAATDNSAVVKNLIVSDSYFKSTGPDLGSIAGLGRGRFETIKSEASVVGAHARVGGLIGQSNGTNVKITDCWFAGSVKNTNNHKDNRGTGGFVGIVYDGKLSIDNCLNTGDVDVSAYTTKFPGTNVIPVAGGFVGRVMSDVLLDVTDSMSTKGVLVSSDAIATNMGFGSLLGYTDNVKGTNITGSYTTASPIAGSSFSGKVFEKKEAEILGYKGYQWTLLDFDKYWTVVINPKEGTPILQSFASEVPSLENVDKMMNISWQTEYKGTSDAPYLLSDKADLYGLAMLSVDNDFAGKYFKLTKDIVVNEGIAKDWAKKAPEYAWTPIGSNALPFNGILDGDMHSIRGIYVNTTGAYAGLFAATGEQAFIKNLKLENSYFNTTAAKIGSIAGLGNGQFHTIYSDAIVVSSNADVGGIIGESNGSDVKITNVWFAGNVKNTANHKNYRGTGGIIGSHTTGKVTISNCLNSGLIDVSAYTYNQNGPTQNPNVSVIAAGIVGWIKTSAAANVKTAVIMNCLNTGTVATSTSTTGAYGLIIGLYNVSGCATVTNSYGIKENAVNYDSKGYDRKMVTSVAMANAIGNKATTNMPNLGIGTAFVEVPYSTPVLKSFEKQMIDTSWYDETKGTYVLYDRADLYGLAVLSQDSANLGFADKTVVLGADIIVNAGDADDWAKGAPGFRWLTIGTKAVKFKGTFDGDMHTIYGIYLNTAAENGGLFGSTEADSLIQELRLENSYFCSTKPNLGSIVGLGYGELNKVYSNAYVTSSHARVGGMIGMAHGNKVKLSKCWFDGTVVNTANHKDYRGTGGFIGVMYDGCVAELYDCLMTGTVDAETYTYNQNTTGGTNITPIAGGLVGWVKTASSNLTVKRCINLGTVKASDSATGGYGLIVGLKEGTVNIEKTTTYSTDSNWTDTKMNKSNLKSSHQLVEEDDIKGKALDGFDFVNVWKVILDKTPILKDFED